MAIHFDSCCSRRVTAIALLSGALSPGAAAQTGPPRSAAFRQIAAEVQRQLRSTEPAEVAGGAFRAAEFRVDEAIPDLERILESPPVTGPFERSAMVAAVLDAGVQLRAGFSPNVLRNHFARWPIQTLILLGYAKDSGSVLMDLLRGASGFAWFAAANLLVERKEPGFAAEVLSKIQFRLRVHVTDNESLGLGAGYGGGSSACGIGVNPTGFPPTAFYEFSSAPRPGNIILSNGPHTVYYSRTVYNQSQYPTSYAGISGPNDADRMTYVTWLVVSPADRILWAPNAPNRVLQPEQSEAIQWRGADDYAQRATTFRNNFYSRYRTLLNGLRTNQLLTDEEVTTLTAPHVDFQILDNRHDRSVPLPTLAPVVSAYSLE